MPKQTTCKMFITLTTNPKIYKKESLVQADIMIPIVVKLLRKIEFFGDVYCEGTRAGNIHFHGIGTFKYPEKSKYAGLWLTNYLKRNSFNSNRTSLEPNFENIGFIDVEQCMNEEKQIAYISKDRTKSIELFKRHHIWEENYPIDPTLDLLGLTSLEPHELPNLFTEQI